MNFLEPRQAGREAVIRYLDADFQIVREGDFVRCAATGAAIPLPDLRYWNVSLQRAYGSAEAAFTAHIMTRS
ncbi:DUF2093 domain-containing protein [Aestuariivirga litoralis]|uniref:DUF2093 domain-containing protein n=1 Tax=Aestuariivirga litoralis TaxID=2650924 RepID=A0A2W2BPN1_9HYPH|nr:DUF2093 domain-containing protein [Aestuariivirga litoralis]PZF77687.1 DUF2093 domain-containing protein [Aestuariivirga litoralis]